MHVYLIFMHSKFGYCKYQKDAIESTTLKSAKNPKPAIQLKPVQKDTQKDARKFIKRMGVILEVTVLTNME